MYNNYFPTTTKAETVYYDTKIHCFRTIRDEDAGLVSRPARFYNDAKTTTRTETLPQERIEGDLVEIHDPTEFEYVKYNDNVNGWEIVNTGPDAIEREELLQRRFEFRDAINVTGSEGVELVLEAAEKVGGRVVVEFPTEEDMKRFLDEYEVRRAQATSL